MKIKPKIVEMSEIAEGVVNNLSYSFLKTDGGRSNFFNSGMKMKNLIRDCAPRALAVSTGTSYKDAVHTLREYGGLTSGGAFFNRFVHALEWNSETYFGFSFEYISFPAAKGKRRMNPHTFCREYTEGKYICRTAHHVFAVVDGIIHDSWEPRPNCCIYGAWNVVRIEEQ